MTDDTPRDPLAALDEALRRWSFVHEDDFDPSSERVHAAWLAASAALDARPSGDEALRAADALSRPRTVMWAEPRRLADRAGIRHRLQKARAALAAPVSHSEVDAAAWHAAVCESPTGKARPSGDEALLLAVEEVDNAWHDEGDHIEYHEELAERLITLRDEYAALAAPVSPSPDPHDVWAAHLLDGIHYCPRCVAGDQWVPVSPSPAMQTRAVPDGPIIKNATVTSLAPVSPSPAPETTFDPVTMKYPPRESVDAARLLSAHELLLRELDVLLHADIDPHIKEHVETAIRWANEAPVSPSNPDDQMGSVPGRPGDTFRLNKTHHIVVTSDGENIVLHVDGDPEFPDAELVDKIDREFR